MPPLVLLLEIHFLKIRIGAEGMSSCSMARCFNCKFHYLEDYITKIVKEELSKREPRKSSKKEEVKDEPKEDVRVEPKPNPKDNDDEQ